MSGLLFIINVPQKEHEVFIVKNKIKQPKHDVPSKSTPDISDSLHDSKSEITLNVSEVDGREGKSSSKLSIKQVLKSRNKFKITRPTRGTDILAAFHCDTPLETILSDVMDRLNVKNATWCATQNSKFWQVTFSLESGQNCEELLQVLRTFGFGSRHESSLSIVPCTLFYGAIHKNQKGIEACEKDSKTGAWSRFSSSVQARTNLAQVLHSVRAEAAVTFDWCFLLLVAALVASIGLVENSTVVLVASMLISPLMGPITAGTLGTAVRDRTLQTMGLMHELLGLFMCLVIGFIFGLAICAVDSQLNIMSDWPTSEMMSRCEYRSLWVGVLVAIPSGAGVAIAVLGDYTASLVGVAISASLLPPAVNAGLLWAMSVYRIVAPHDLTWRVGDPFDLAVLGSRSLCLTLINIVCIYIAGVTVYKVKNVYPLEQRDITWWKANQTRLQASNWEDTAWDLYSGWSRSAAEKTVDSKVHETITFRRPHVLQRMKAENLEQCLRNHKMDDNYQAMDSETTSVSQNSDSLKPKDIVIQCECTEFCSDNLSYEKSESEDCPTLEPSQSFTLDAKRNGTFNLN